MNEWEPTGPWVVSASTWAPGDVALRRIVMSRTVQRDRGPGRPPEVGEEYCITAPVDCRPADTDAVRAKRVYVFIDAQREDR